MDLFCIGVCELAGNNDRGTRHLFAEIIQKLIEIKILTNSCKMAIEIIGPFKFDQV